MDSKKEATYLELFISVTKAITSSLDPVEVFELITRKIPVIVGVKPTLREGPWMKSWPPIT